MGANRRRLAAYLALGVLPWSVVLAGDYATLVWPFGLVDPARLTVTDPYSYLFVYTRGLPGYLFAWPLGVGLYLGALVSVLVGELTGYEDRRVTAGLLVLVALTHTTFTWGLTTRPGYVAVPLVSVAVLLVVWLVEWPAISGTLLPTSR